MLPKLLNENIYTSRRINTTSNFKFVPLLYEDTDKNISVEFTRIHFFKHNKNFYLPEKLHVAFINLLLQSLKIKIQDIIAIGNTKTSIQLNIYTFVLLLLTFPQKFSAVFTDEMYENIFKKLENFCNKYNFFFTLNHYNHALKITNFPNNTYISNNITYIENATLSNAKSYQDFLTYSLKELHNFSFDSSIKIVEAIEKKLKKENKWDKENFFISGPLYSIYEQLFGQSEPTDHQNTQKAFKFNFSFLIKEIHKNTEFSNKIKIKPQLFKQIKRYFQEITLLLRIIYLEKHLGKVYEKGIFDYDIKEFKAITMISANLFNTKLEFSKSDENKLIEFLNKVTLALFEIAMINQLLLIKGLKKTYLEAATPK